MSGIDTDSDRTHPDRHALDADSDPDQAKWCWSHPIRIRVHNSGKKSVISCTIQYFPSAVQPFLRNLVHSRKFQFFLSLSRTQVVDKSPLPPMSSPVVLFSRVPYSRVLFVAYYIWVGDPNDYNANLKGGFFGFFLYVRYSRPLHLRFQCDGECWDWTRDCCDFGISSQRLLPLG